MHIHPHVMAHPTCQYCGKRPSTILTAIRCQLFALCEQCHDLLPAVRALDATRQWVSDDPEFHATKRAVEAARAGTGCVICGASNPGHARRHKGTILVTCERHQNEVPKPNQAEIRALLTKARAVLEHIETRARALR